MRLILMRGLPGSGKSSLAKQFVQSGDIILSTDDFFVVNGVFTYDGSLIKDAHTWNQGRARAAMMAGIETVIIDNTFMEAWEMTPYVRMAQDLGYEVEIHEPDTWWRYDPAECARRTVHGVPEIVIRGMQRLWQPDLTVEDILQARRAA